MAAINAMDSRPDGLPVIQLEGRFYCNKRNLPPQCLVRGCNFTDALIEPYYKRYRICREHARMPAILMNGVQQRFCQQCGRFQKLGEFEGSRRNCREKLQSIRIRKKQRRPAVRTSSSELAARMLVPRWMADGDMAPFLPLSGGPTGPYVDLLLRHSPSASAFSRVR